MEYKVLLEPDAELDLATAFGWYEEQLTGLGHEFLVSVRASLERLERLPFSNKTVLDDLRRAKLKRFPFGIFYLIKKDVVHVVGFMHSRRDPEEWSTRRAKTKLL